MGGSQLSQLKDAINNAGLGRTSTSKSSKKKGGGHAGRSGKDRAMNGDLDARKNKLDAIHQSMNRFDVKSTKTKHHIVNAKPLKGSTGRPGLSRQVGIDTRRKTLLPQLLDRNHTGRVVDRRFGESDPTLTPEEKALQRFTSERQKKASKASIFNLDDDEDDNLLTHYGQSLSSAPAPLDDQEDLFRRALQSREKETEAPARKKSKAEVMEEVIAKSKAYKHERQRVKDQDEDLRLQLDGDLAGIRTLLGSINKRDKAPSSRFTDSSLPTQVQVDDSETVPPARATGPVVSTSQVQLSFHPASHQSAARVDRNLLESLLGVDHEDEDNEVLKGLERNASSAQQPMDQDDDPYDRFVRELAFDKRAHAGDRLKTDLELAQDAAASLQQSERARLKRMRGEKDESETESEGSSDDEEQEGKRVKKIRKGKQRAPQGDDLGDFDLDDGEMNGVSLGQGLRLEDLQTADNQSPSVVEGEPEAEEEGSDGDEEDEESPSSKGDDDDTGSEKAENEMLADLLQGEESAEDETQHTSLVQTGFEPSAVRQKSASLPFTFPCPATHQDFLGILEGTVEKDLSTIVQRIRTLYHPSLAEGNKSKLAAFLAVLLDHLLYSASVPAATNFNQVNILLPQIQSMTKSFPLSAATYCVRKLTLMQKNLARGLQLGPLASSAKTWPGAGELVLLRLIGTLWSTSDFHHPVVSPATLLISQYLGQCRIRSLSDISSGLFLCTIILQYEESSKRYFPEVLNFVVESFLLLIGGDSAPITADFPVPDYSRADLRHLILDAQVTDSILEEPLDFLRTLRVSDDDAVTKGRLALLSLTLVGQLATMWTGLPAFIEAFEPILELVDTSSEVPVFLRDKLEITRGMLTRMLKFAHTGRKPLTLQQHKPIPIPSFLPKFDAGYAPGRRFDPDVERNEAAKLKALVRKEKKGAVRELRKDARFIAGEKARMQRDKDDEYKSKINRITAGLEQERADEKRFERTKEKTKARDKKRAGGARR